MPANKTPEQWAAEYGSQREKYVDFAQRVSALIVDLLAAEGIEVIQVESRAKTVASFAEKIQRKGRENSNPFETLTDLVGVRVITYYLDDVTRVGDLIDREFQIDSKNSIDKSQDLASDQFGYRSAHYVASLTSERAGLIEWRAFTGLSIEFQVRTALQHAWAAVSHKLEYKSADEAPEAVKRKLFRLSALFEIADEQFASIRDERQETDIAYRLDIGHGNLDIPIDTSSIEAFWSLSDGGRRLKSHFSRLGYQMDDTGISENRRERDRRDLVKVLRSVGMGTIGELDRYVQRNDIRSIADATHEIDLEDSDGGVLYSSEDDLLTQLIIIKKDKIDTLGRTFYTDEAADALQRTKDRLHAKRTS